MVTVVNPWGCYNSPPLKEILVPRIQEVERRKGVRAFREVLLEVFPRSRDRLECFNSSYLTPSMYAKAYDMSEYDAPELK